MAHVCKYLKLPQNWAYLRKPTKPKHLELSSEFRTSNSHLRLSWDQELELLNSVFTLHSLSLSLSKMWASAEGGPPEVTLETSMGSFTVEVLPLLFNSLLFGCSESHRKSNKVINWVFFILFFIINVILFWLLKFECEIN